MRPGHCATVDDDAVSLREPASRSTRIPELRVAIIVLNWNGREDTVECVRSLLKVPGDNIRIVIVDNGSIDGSPDVFRREFPDLTVLETGRNLGYAGGNNYGIRYALD